MLRDASAPEEFPRIRFEVLLPEVERQGLDAFVRIGEEVSEVVEQRIRSVDGVMTERLVGERWETEV